jgi:hypothetical protein
VIRMSVAVFLNSMDVLSYWLDTIQGHFVTAELLVAPPTRIIMLHF